MQISSHNEWDKLKTVVLGNIEYANWPTQDQVFQDTIKNSLWKQSSFRFGPVNDVVIEETHTDLSLMCEELEKLGILVLRPSERNYQKFDGFYGYCPRDLIAIIGETAVAAPMLFPSRRQDWETILSADDLIFCNDAAVQFDAANICRLNQDILYLVSCSGNQAGANWLQDQFGDQYRIHVLENIYGGVHLDSTITPLQEGLVLLNADRINEDNMPQPLKNWDKIWLHSSEIAQQGFLDFPYASNWIAMNLLTIEPGLVMCDPNQNLLRKKLNQHGIESIGISLRHSRTLGGGHHCVTLDLERVP